MLGSILLTTLLAAVAAVRADPSPLTPDTANEGATCRIAWEPDTTGLWKTMYIELMTGQNLAMVHLTTVATVDGTNPANSTFEYTCPQVTPNSAIYFYQFTSPNANDTVWTTRFAIADANGNTTPPPQNTQPNGQPIPWGRGALVDPSTANPPPPTAGSNASTSSNSTSSPVLPPSSSAPSSPPVSSPPASGSPSISVPVSSVNAPGKTVTGSSSSASANMTGAAAKTNSASGITMDSRLLQGAASLVAATVAFAFAL